MNALLQRYEFIPYQLEYHEISQVETRDKQEASLSGFANIMNKKK